MRVGHVEPVVVKHAADQRAEDCPAVAQQDRLQAGVESAAPGSKGHAEKAHHDADEHRQPDQPHVLGDDQVQHAHAQVDVHVGRAGEADAKQRVALDQDQRVLVLAKAHLRRQVLAGKALEQAGDIVLRNRQQQEQQRTGDHPRDQPPVLEHGHHRQRRGQPQQRRTAVGEVERQHRRAKHDRHQPARKKPAFGDQLRPQQRRHQDHHAAQHVGIDRGANGAHRARGVVFDKAQRARPPRIVKARQPVKNGNRPRLRDDIEQNRNAGAGPAAQHHPARDPVNFGLPAHGVDRDKEEADAQ